MKQLPLIAIHKFHIYLKRTPNKGCVFYLVLTRVKHMNEKGIINE